MIDTAIIDEQPLDIQLLYWLEKSWRGWLKQLFPSYCIHPFSKYPGYHTDFWNWLWSVERYEKPPAFLTIWPRRGAKSTSIELGAVALGCRDRRKYALYISGTQDQADDHVVNVGALLENPNLAAYYPAMSSRRVGKHGNIRGWRRNRLWTQSGFVIDALGLDSAARGAKLEEQRPDLIILDDLDDHADSPAITENKKETLGKSILPAGSDDVAIVGAQNLVHRNSIFAQLIDGRFPALANRVEAAAIPALIDAEYERDGRRTIIVRGEPTWEGLNVPACQKLIDDFTLDYFLSECQHEVNEIRQGAIYPMWDEKVHLISWTEFLRIYSKFTNGKPQIPQHWKVSSGLDWGSTIDHPCVVTWFTKAAENSPLAGTAFAYREFTAYEQTPRQVAERIINLEWPGREREAGRMALAVLSHEQKAIRDTFSVHHKLHFASATPDRIGGIAQMADYLEIDRTNPHPFKDDRLGSDGLWELGSPNLFYIVDDDQLEHPIDDRGFARHRAEFASYRWDVPAKGEPSQRIIPYAFFNDAMDSDRIQADLFLPKIAALSKFEKEELKLPEPLRAVSCVAVEDSEDRARTWQTRQIQIAKNEKAERLKNGKNLFGWIENRNRARRMGY